VKLELTLPERPGLLHAVPLMDLFALLWLLFLLAPSLLRQSGVSVEPPPSRFQLDRYQDSLVVTLGPGEGTPRIHLNREPLDLARLSARLDELRGPDASTDTIVLLQTDPGTPVGLEREISELVLSKGYRLALVGSNVVAPAPRESEPTPE
jgi:biopolymer transport protein ExbD